MALSDLKVSCLPGVYILRLDPRTALLREGALAPLLLTLQALINYNLLAVPQELDDCQGELSLMLLLNMGAVHQILGEPGEVIHQSLMDESRVTPDERLYLLHVDQSLLPQAIIHLDLAVVLQDLDALETLTQE